MKTDDKTLIDALDILARDIQTDDGVANACIAEAAQRLRELTEWRPIETAPKDGTLILCGKWYCDDWDGTVSFEQWVNWWCKNYGFNGNAGEKPTHWMPLPAAPQPTEKK